MWVSGEGIPYQLFLLEREQLWSMLEASGLDVAYFPSGLQRRGLSIGKAPF